MTSAVTSPLQAELLAADAVGDVIAHWGFRKALGRMWTMLYLAGTPLSAGELGERLQMSAGAVSMALGELQHWAVVRRVWIPGERKEFYEAEVDFWKMISKVVSERERFLLQSVRERLEAAELALHDAGDATLRERQMRLRKLLTFTQMAETLLQGFITSHTLDFSRFANLLDFKRRAPQKLASPKAQARRS